MFRPKREDYDRIYGSYKLWNDDLYDTLIEAESRLLGVGFERVVPHFLKDDYLIRYEGISTFYHKELNLYVKITLYLHNDYDNYINYLEIMYEPENSDNKYSKTTLGRIEHFIDKPWAVVVDDVLNLVLKEKPGVEQINSYYNPL